MEIASTMKIAFGCDHAGYEGPEPLYKHEIIKHLQEKGLEVIDCGTYGPDSVDYPDYANMLCEKMLAGEAERGILMCGTGIGISMAANRHKGIRAATCVTEKMTVLSREHNNANVLCLGRRTLSLEECLKIIDVWLDTPFSNGTRHLRRIEKMG